jgi:elongator complex protein 1
VRVWDRATGELHARGEAAAGLLPAAAWQPNGRHLYVACDKAAAAAAPVQDEAAQPAGAQQPAQQGAALAAQQPAEMEQARQAAAEGIAHVGAWKRELRRRLAARAAAGGAAAAAAASGAVLLFERNGLQHGSFELPAACAGSAIEQLAWSADSECLAVVLSEEGRDGGLWLGGRGLGA